MIRFLFDWSPVVWSAGAEFSRQYCVAICAVCVPANLLATLQTLMLVGFRRPRWLVVSSAALALLAATVMGLHVLSWWVVGVVRLPTFVLLGLAGICGGLNGSAIAIPARLGDVLRSQGMTFARRLRPWTHRIQQT